MQATRFPDLSQFIEATKISKALFERAQRSFPSGSTRSPYYYSPYPLYIKRAEGCYVWDVDDNKYLDFANNMGPLVLGHRHPTVMKAVADQVERFWCGGPTELEVELAETILRAFPMGDRVLFTPTGTEASMKVIRAVRASTGKQRIMMSTGAYHGSHDSVSSGFGIPTSNERLVTRFQYNNENSFQTAFKRVRKKLAGVLIEGVLGVAGSIPPTTSFLEIIREETEKHGIPLIFDEVVTGFRVAKGGISERFGVKPDCVILGKNIGGGFPIGAFLGPEEIMAGYAYPKTEFPLIGKPRILHSGTFNAHPVSMAAGLATLSVLTADAFQHLEWFGNSIRKILAELGDELHIPYCITGLSSLYRLFFTKKRIDSYESLKNSDETKERLFDAFMLANGVSIPAYHTAFCSLPMSKTELDKFKTAANASLIGIESTKDSK